MSSLRFVRRRTVKKPPAKTVATPPTPSLSSVGSPVGVKTPMMTLPPPSLEGDDAPWYDYDYPHTASATSPIAVALEDIAAQPTPTTMLPGSNSGQNNSAPYYSQCPHPCCVDTANSTNSNPTTAATTPTDFPFPVTMHYHAQGGFNGNNVSFAAPPPDPYKFKTKLCGAHNPSTGSMCPNGNMCIDAHGRNELRTREINVPVVRKLRSRGIERAVVDPNKFKVRLCEKYEATGECPFGAQCMFAHGAEELRDVSVNRTATDQIFVMIHWYRIAKQQGVFKKLKNSTDNDNIGTNNTNLVA
eukprot:PhM_4_TR5367/c0_g1_i1/m.29125